MQGPTTELSAEDHLGELVEDIVEIERRIAAEMARRAQLIDQAREWTDATAVPDRGRGAGSLTRRSLVAEIGAALRLPQRTAESLIGVSEVLVADLARTFTALSAGRISWRHAQTIVDAMVGVPTSARDAFETQAVELAAQGTVAQLAHRLRVLRERVHPEASAERHRTARRERCVLLSPAADGMSWLSALRPAAEAEAIFDRLTADARTLQRSKEKRTLSQLRSDVFADLLLGDGTAGPDARRLRPRILVTVPVLTLLGASAEPGLLDGYGPIDPDTARELAAAAPSFTRLLTCPETGAVLSVGREQYRTPSDLRRWLRLRDGTCRFPGCRRNAVHCDVDHTEPWADGKPTAGSNLAHLCRGHHRLKHAAGWRVTQGPDGVARWTAPSGRAYQTDPAVRLDGHGPPGTDRVGNTSSDPPF